MAQYDDTFVVLITGGERQDMTARAYVKKQLKEHFGKNIPMDQISITKNKDFWWETWRFDVKFNKKSQEYAVLFKMLF